MGQRVLVFEKNTNFLQELESGFGRLGVEVEVANDVEAAVSAAKTGAVSMVIVSVEAMSAPGEAFLVCKRFKSDDDLTRIPFVLMGGAAHAESIASHRKLKRKADQYVELPVTFESLMAQLEPVLPFDASSLTADNGAHNMQVDADIDAFADSAFDDLVLDEAPAVPEPSPELVASLSEKPAAQPMAFAAVAAPAAPAVDRASERELARLRAELEETRNQSSAAEERALTAERRAKAAEASRASVPPPPTAGVSSRDYLELREQLNRKDKELLGLRDEVTSRDRRLLDASDRTLELERAQAQQEETIESLQRELEESTTKVAGYEVDLDAAKKRRDELNARLGRADDSVRRLEAELDKAREKHTSELAEFKNLLEQQVRGLEEQAAADSARLRADHAAQQERLASSHADALAGEQARARAELTATKEQHERSLAERDSDQRDALARAASERERALADLKNSADAAQASALAAAADDRAMALANAAADHAALLAQKQSEAEAARVAALDGLRSELELRFAGQTKERDDKHNKELAVLGRKLTEADNKAAALQQRIEEQQQKARELEQSLSSRIAMLEADLATRTEERDLTNNELSSARARIASLEHSDADKAQRINSIESNLYQAEQRIQRQSSKIAHDDELLERVRKALGISIGLLEQQRSHGSDA
jgi:chromosome segregation ATPase